MKVLLVGSGAREHALAWAISRSPRLKKLYLVPGSAGAHDLGEVVPVELMNIHGIADAAHKRRVDLVVVGPEAPLTAGLTTLVESRGIAVFGPSAAAAMIEGSKGFAKEFMTRFKIPTPPYGVFENPPEAIQYIRRRDRPLVVKADGLAAGKGVFVCSTPEEAEAAALSLMERYSLGRAGRRVVIEDRLRGRELSLMALTDGDRAWLLPTSRDHKTLNDGGAGPNTGGMGAYAPVPEITAALARELFEKTLRPAIAGLLREARRFRGVLYAGLMLTDDGPKVLEYNCRFGDPEAQVLLPLARFDWLEAFWQAATGILPPEPPKDAWQDRAAVGVVLAAEGYPGKVTTGDAIEGLGGAGDALVFHGGTKREGGGFVTAGGRVLTAVGLGSDLADARQRAYSAAERINFRGRHMRKDIAAG